MPVTGAGAAGKTFITHNILSNAGEGYGAGRKNSTTMLCVMPTGGKGRGSKNIVGFSGGADQPMNVKTSDARKADRRKKSDI